MRHQIRYGLLQPFLTGSIFSDGLGRTCGEEIIPDGIPFPLEVAGLGGNGNHHVLIRNHDAQLPSRSVTAKRIVGAPPELKAIALSAIDSNLGMRFLLIRHLLACCLFHPCLCDQLLAIPLALLEVELTELGDVFRTKLQAVATEGITLRAAVPLRILNLKGSNNRGFRYSSVVCRVTLVMIAESV